MSTKKRKIFRFLFNFFQSGGRYEKREDTNGPAAGCAAGGAGGVVPPMRRGALPLGRLGPCGGGAALPRVRLGDGKKGGCREKEMTLLELSKDYRAHAQALKGRIGELEARYPDLPEEERCRMDERIHMLGVMWREARDLAVLTERYYERGYRRNARYTI